MKKILAITGTWLIAATAAQATPVSFVSTGPQQLTYFAGTVQQSVVTLNDGAPFKIAPSTLDLTLGVPVTVRAHEISVSTGQNDGSYNVPNETHTFTGSFQLGGQTVQFSEDVTFRQILNNQFQMDVAASSPGAVYVPGLGTVDIQLEAFSVQFLAQHAGSGHLVATTFTLTSAVPEPATAMSLLLGLGFLPVAVRVARRA